MVSLRVSTWNILGSPMRLYGSRAGSFVLPLENERLALCLIQAVEDLLTAGGGNRSYQSIQCRGRRRDHTPEAQHIFSLLLQRFREHALGQLGKKMLLQIGAGDAIKALVA